MSLVSINTTSSAGATADTLQNSMIETSRAAGVTPYDWGAVYPGTMPAGIVALQSDPDFTRVDLLWRKSITPLPTEVQFHHRYRDGSIIMEFEGKAVRIHVDRRLHVLNGGAHYDQHGDEVDSPDQVPLNSREKAACNIAYDIVDVERVNFYNKHIGHPELESEIDYDDGDRTRGTRKALVEASDLVMAALDSRQALQVRRALNKATGGVSELDWRNYGALVKRRPQ